CHEHFIDEEMSASRRFARTATGDEPLLAIECSALPALALGKSHQPVRSDHCDLLTPTLYQPFLLPGVEQAADRMQRRPGHFRDVLARYGEIDADAVSGFPASLVDQPHEGVRHALLHLLGRHFGDARMSFLESRAHGPVRI